MSGKDGGPAFACASDCGHQPGMSLRDWFAGQALTGFLASAGSLQMKEDIPAEVAFAKASYGMADAMLAERERSK